MKKIILTSLILSSIVISGCDVAKVFDTAPKYKKTNKKTNPWTCIAVVSPSEYVFEDNSRVVTVKVANVIVPTLKDSPENTIISQTTEMPVQKVMAFSKKIYPKIQASILNKKVKIQPPPNKNQSYMPAVIVFSPSVDFNSYLVKSGYAIVDPAVTTDLNSKYKNYQSEALDYGKGIWNTPVILDDKFKIQANVNLENYNDQTVQTASDSKNKLRRFHSKTLIHAPKYVPVTVNKNHVAVSMQVVLNLNVIAKGPAKEYELDLKFRPLVIANEYIGPLDSFKEENLPWQKESFHIRGGQTNTTEMVSEPIELFCQTKVATRKSYTGYITVGYEVKVMSNNKLIYSDSGKYDQAETLGGLTTESTSLF